jgi:hypothetical protein
VSFLNCRFQLSRTSYIGIIRPVNGMDHLADKMICTDLHDRDPLISDGPSFLIDWSAKGF